MKAQQSKMGKNRPAKIGQETCLDEEDRQAQIDSTTGYASQIIWQPKQIASYSYIQWGEC